MRDWRSLALGSLSVATGLIVWYLIGALGLVSTDLLAGPADVWAALVDILHNGYRDTTLTQNILATLGRCLGGFAAAAIVGVPLGLWMGLSRMADASLNFVIQFLRPLPPLSYLVLLILWFGAGDLSKIALLFMGAFPTITTAAMAGVRQVSAQRIQAAPLPTIFIGLRIALAGAFSSVVAAELMAASDGLGWMVFSASRFLRTDIILLGIILLGLFGMALSRTLVVIDNRLVHWRGRE
jgi:taurine transport system permease protein